MNLRKDHYRRARPSPRGQPGRQPLAAVRPPGRTQRPLKPRGRSGAPAAAQRTRSASCLASRPGRYGAPLRPSVRRVVLSLFFCLRFSLSRAGHRPRRQGTPPGTRVTQTRPDGADGSPHGYPSNSPVPPPEGGGGFNVPARGARGFLRLELNFFQTKTFVKQNWTKTKKEYNS